MPEIPLILRLKRQQHKELARAQDLVVKVLYNTTDKAVLHGGTAIWRCFGGNRFSEDINVYLDRKDVVILFERLEQAGFEIVKKKVTENSLFSKLRLGIVEVRFESLFRRIKGHLSDFETVDGNYLSIYSLTPEEFIKEKVNAYLSRRKIRDLYDIYFLMKLAEAADDIEKLIKDFKTPLDEKDLKVLIIQGLVPTSPSMLEYINGKRKTPSKS